MCHGGQRRFEWLSADPFACATGGPRLQFHVRRLSRWSKLVLVDVCAVDAKGSVAASNGRGQFDHVFLTVHVGGLSPSLGQGACDVPPFVVVIDVSRAAVYQGSARKSRGPSLNDVAKM